MKKVNVIKKYFIFMILLLPIIFIKVDAKVFTINEVVDKFNDLANEQATVIGKITAEIQSDNKNVKITWSGTQTAVLLDYGDDYIEFNAKDKVPTSENEEEYYYLLYRYTLNSLLNLSGFAKADAETLEKYDNDYDKYNVSLIYTPYKYKDNSGNDVESTYASNFKIGFDSEKISRLYYDYLDSTHSQFEGLVPVLKLHIEDNELTYKVSLDTTYRNPTCIIYRSTSKDGKYTNILGGDTAIACNGNIATLTDNDAKTGETYYYKAQIVGSSKYTDIYQVDLKNNIITNTVTNEIIESPSKDEEKDPVNPIPDKDNNTKEEETKKDYKNPETGEFLPMLPILILSLISIGVWSKVKNKFVRI